MALLSAGVASDALISARVASFLLSSVSYIGRRVCNASQSEPSASISGTHVAERTNPKDNNRSSD